MIEVLLLTHAATTLVMVGVIWFVQIVHYPLMARVSASEFADYEREHQNRTTLVVAPTMLVEAAAATLLLVVPLSVGRALPAVGVGLLAVIWLSTFFVQVKLHSRLADGFDAASHRRLVQSNWLRTAAWTGRGILALVMLNLA